MVFARSTLKVFDLDAPPASALKDTIATGGTTPLDEMALTSNGNLLIAANNAEDPPFATLFQANGNAAKDQTKILAHITVDKSIIPEGLGLSLEQPAWDPMTKRFYSSIPIILGNPAGCNADGNAGPITCNGGVLVTDPDAIEDSFKGTIVNVVQGTFDAKTNTWRRPVQEHVRAERRQCWSGRQHHLRLPGSSRDCAVPGTPCPSPSQQKAVLGVIDAQTNTLIEKIPQSSGSHSVATDSKRNLIFVPQVAPVATVGSGGDTTSVDAAICGTNNGCVAVYQHNVKSHNDGDDEQGDDDQGDVAQNNQH